MSRKQQLKVPTGVIKGSQEEQEMKRRKKDKEGQIADYLKFLEAQKKCKN